LGHVFRGLEAILRVFLALFRHPLINSLLKYSLRRPASREATACLGRLDACGMLAPIG
jgi:hypothetical protein